MRPLAFRDSIGWLERIGLAWIELHHGGPGLAGRASRAVADRRAGEATRFDLVVLIEADAFGSGIEGAVDRYVAMTRATERLVVLTPREPASATRRPLS